MTLSIPASIIEPISRGDFDNALEAVLKELSADSGTIHFLESDSLLHLAAHGQGLPEEVLERIRFIPIGKGMAGLAVERAEPVSICNMQSDDSGDVQPGARATGLEGSIAVPIMNSDQQPIGTLGVANRAPRTFTDDEIAMLSAIGEALAAARARESAS